ncbi:MAG: sigma-70 family RNA polymerase sigma factor [Archangium sp.]|nr:sigma-70 family RNA polymerase sigma factor [Archangium sp.]
MALSAAQRRTFETWLEGRAPRAAWSLMNLEDLELCWLALEHDATAVHEVERRLQRVAKSVAGKKGDDDFVQEVLQRTRARLFVGERPRLAAYSGTGALVQYLKAVVLSVSVDLQRAARHENVSEDELLEAAVIEDGVDARLAHATQRKHFTAAFKESVESLGTEERTWLRMRFVEGLSIDAVGAAFGVHRTTAMRWLERAQKQLMAETRKRLAERLGMPLREVDSLLRAMRPSLAENLSRIFQRPKLPSSAGRASVAKIPSPSGRGSA